MLRRPLRPILLALPLLCGGCSDDPGAEPAPAGASADLGSTAATGAPATRPGPRESAAAPVLWLTDGSESAGEPALGRDGAGRLWTAWLEWRLEGPTIEVACLARDGGDWRVLARARAAETDRGLAEPTLVAGDDGAYLAFETRGSETRGSEARGSETPASVSGTGDHQRLVGRTLALRDGAIGLGPLETIAQGALEPRLAAIEPGRLIAVWQGSVADRYDILTAVREGDRWGAIVNVSASPWDEWSPRVAAGPNGAAWIAWDAYVDGSFDVFAHGPVGGDGAATIRVAGTPAFEGYPELAIDGDGRPWIAFESTPSWGRAGALRERRAVELVRLEPDGSLRSAELGDAAVLDGQFPRPVIGAQGLALAARHPDEPFAPRDRQGAAKNAAGTLHSWHSTLTTFADGVPAGAKIAGSTGDNEATEQLAVVGDELVVLLAGDDRRRFFGGVDLWNQPIERTWRVGLVALDSPRGWPALGDAREPAPPVVDGRPPAPSAEGWLFGDLHRHTHLSRCAGASDGTGLDNYRYARGPGRLDFVSITDHFQHLSLWSWWRTLRDAERYNAPPTLVALPGIERNVDGRGHQNLVYADLESADGDSDGWDPQAEGSTRWAADRVVAIPHMLSSATNRFAPESLDDGVHAVAEIYQGTRGTYESQGSPYAARDRYHGGPHAADFLAQSDRLGWIAASDHGESNDGFGVVRGADPSRASILAALHDRRALAATGRAVARMQIGDRSDGERGPIRSGDAVRVEFGASDAAPATVELLVDGAVAARRDGGPAAPRELFTVTTQFRPARADRPLRITIDRGAIVGARLRRGERHGVGFELVDERTVNLWSGRQRAELVLEIAFDGEAPRLSLVFLEDRQRVELERIEPGRSRRMNKMQGSLEAVWRIGAPLEDPGAAVAFENLSLRPGSAVYARLAYRDGNVVWTSPVHVTEVVD